VARSVIPVTRVEPVRPAWCGTAPAPVQVTNGRLVLDEPTDLPDGAEVEVIVLDDDLTAEERADLHASLDRALDDSESARGIDTGQYLAQYRRGATAIGS
jgi:hypothetical protein